MRGLIALIAVFALALAAALAARSNTGYALLVLPPWRVEVSLNFLVLAVLAAFVLGWIALALLLKVLRLPSAVRALAQRRRKQRGENALVGALRSLYEGRYGQTEKLAAQACDLGTHPVLAALVAARAAQRRRDFTRRDRWLARAAEEASQEWRSAQRLTEAELLLEERRWSEARALLAELHAGGPKHIATLLLLLRAEQGLGNWDEVLRLARLAEKRGALPPEAIESLRVNARLAQIEARAQDGVELARWWRELPSSERTHPRLAAVAARALVAAGEHRAARRAIEEALEREWQPELARIYADCSDDDATGRLQRAERWLGEHREDAALLFALGRICLELGLWGKAKSYLEASLAREPRPEVHRALAALAEETGEREQALEHYRAAAQSATALPSRPKAAA